MQTLPSDSTGQVPRELVHEHLAAVLASPEFADSARLSRFLKYVVDQTLEGNAAALKEYCVGVDVFDRAADYDPKTDPVVRVQARQLRFKLAAYYAAANCPEDVVISIPKGGYGVRFERAAAAAPAYDLEQVASFLPDPPVLPGSSRWRIGMVVLALAVVAGVVAGAAAVAWRAFAPGVVPQPSIAVLPFIRQ